VKMEKLRWMIAINADVLVDFGHAQRCFAGERKKRFASTEKRRWMIAILAIAPMEFGLVR